MIKNALRVVAVFSLLLPAYAQAVTVNLNPAVEFDIRSDFPDNHGENNGMLIDRVLGGSGGFEVIASFDLSGITEDPNDLASATLSFVGLYGEPFRVGTFGCCMGQLASVFDANATAVASMTWNTFQAGFEAGKTTLSGLGVIADGSIPDGTVQVGDTVLTTGLAADLDLIKAVLNGGSNDLLNVLLEGETASNRMYWGDGVLAGDNGVQPAALLILDFGGLVIPPGDFDKDGNVTTLDFDIMKANWFTTGHAPNENGEVTNDGKVDLADFKEFKDNLFPGGASAFAAAMAVPEPGSIALLMAAAPAWLAMRSRRKRRGMGVS